MGGTFMEASSWFIPFDQDVTTKNSELPLPLLLFEEGYDVWLGNLRGTKYSRKHERLNSSDPNSDYWKFSWAEKGGLDIPAAIKKIQKEANVSKVTYIGGSHGSTIMFYALT